MAALKAVTSSVDVWRTVAVSIAALVEEASFEANEAGISFRAMDPSHVAMIDLSWSKTAFEEYSCEGKIRFGLRMEDLVKMLKGVDKANRVELAIEEGDTVTFSFFSEDEGGVERWRLQMVEVFETGTPPLPKINFSVSAQLSAALLGRCIKRISTISDHIMIEANPDSLTFKGRSEFGEVTLTVPKSASEIYDYKVKESAAASYNLDFLDAFIKSVSKATPTVLFEFSNKSPLKLESRPAEGLTLTFFLAPRLE
ncbi:MAG: proliferating cell nuclear antigen (pcna) [Nitrososphaerota archaeon]